MGVRFAVSDVLRWLADRREGELTGSGSFRHLVDAWLDDLDLVGELAPSTRACAPVLVLDGGWTSPCSRNVSSHRRSNPWRQIRSKYLDGLVARCAANGLGAVVESRLDPTGKSSDEVRGQGIFLPARVSRCSAPDDRPVTAPR